MKKKSVVLRVMFLVAYRLGLGCLGKHCLKTVVAVVVWTYRYTYGQPVRGTADVSVSIKTYSYELNRYSQPPYQQRFKRLTVQVSVDLTHDVHIYYFKSAAVSDLLL